MKTKWTREKLLEHLDEFNQLYGQRPIKDNSGGMNSSHMFSAWFIVQTLKPKVLIESGVWKGLGTWFFEKASPDTHIISIDPEPRFREYTSVSVDYQTLDFLETDWSAVDKENSLVFFDDHQNSFERLQKCLDLGFKRVIVEDNYPYQQGDCYSPKKILANRNYVIDIAGVRNWHPNIDTNLEWFKRHVEVYQEMNPIFVDEMTRWGDKWNPVVYPTPKPLLGDHERAEYTTFFEERFDYTWICYLEIG